jgi:hypothetical protein
MKACTLIFTLILATTAFRSQAQDTEALQVAERYKGENAVLLRHTEHVTITMENGAPRAVSRVEKEMLLLTDRAPSLYNVSYVHHGFFHKLGDVEAVSLIPDQKGYRSVRARDMKTTRSEDDNIFYDDARQTAITHPALVKYAKTRVSYTMHHMDIHFLPVFFFQHSTPAVHMVFKITAPRNVRIGHVMHGLNKGLVKYSVDEQRNTVTYTWTASDMPRFRSYGDAPSAGHLIPHVTPYIAEYTFRGEKVTVFGKVDDLYRFYYPFIKDINKQPDPKVKQLVASLTEGVTDPEEKARRIYAWVQRQVRYVAFEDGMGGFVPREAGLVCNRKYGDCKDMSSLLVAMFREAGLTAYFTWIGTRNKPYVYAETPLPVADDHMIATLKIGDRWVFMDGTDPTIPFGIPPYGLQGKEALIGMGENKYTIVKVPEANAAQNIMTDTTYLRLKGDMLEGTVVIRYKGYPAWDIATRMMYKNENEKANAVRSMTSRGSNKYIQTGFDYKISEDHAKDVYLRSDFQIGDYIQKAGAERYINLNLHRYYERDLLDTLVRKAPVERKYKIRTRQVVVFEIPAGFRLSYLPPDASGGVPGLWSYRISYHQSGTKVQLVKEYEVNSLYIKPEQFVAHNRLVNDLGAQYKESIILTAD